MVPNPPWFAFELGAGFIPESFDMPPRESGLKFGREMSSVKGLSLLSIVIAEFLKVTPLSLTSLGPTLIAWV